ncbi:uncharacterized protein [Bactrocera oleae]|uniref:uncharacterized protein n=1 Tax=Bactrocera oleae TaxID=104688 RepID=UPI0006B7A337|nr:uncharacterized protein LOC106617821 [Bactrocera oleae]XP_036212843.1 uncharacterized protein LOC106617821 [Bactrocera oleae]XP_036212844.1 uncharacterized protein LOC106617821 [Bactrocera oleae]XP_036212845.1 uncharacterized protein LOC106617821 [Bactrocera oleae]XP_036212846.1 uncharacterized protein LOC106617821 [Bactrocera oleae]
MKSVILLGGLILTSLLAIECSIADGTSKPFVRSRYSKRWRIATTEANPDNSSTATTEQQKNVGVDSKTGLTTIVNNEGKLEETTVMVSPSMPLRTTTANSKVIEEPTKKLISTTTEHPRHNGPNGLPLDYDYYGNGGENEEDAGHK